MFPTSSTGSARPAPENPERWVGVVDYLYPDLRTLEEVVPLDAFSHQPRLFATPEAAAQAAETWGQAYRVSDRTEVLSGIYGGES